VRLLDISQNLFKWPLVLSNHLYYVILILPAQKIPAIVTTSIKQWLVFVLVIITHVFQLPLLYIQSNLSYVTFKGKIEIRSHKTGGRLIQALTQLQWNLSEPNSNKMEVPMSEMFVIVTSMNWTPVYSKHKNCPKKVLFRQI
jgi:hypothetical protein